MESNDVVALMLMAARIEPSGVTHPALLMSGKARGTAEMPSKYSRAVVQRSNESELRYGHADHC